MPLSDGITKNDIEVKFHAKKVEVKLGEEQVVEFDCMDRIIPDGSFWTIETNKDDIRYLQLDLEKR